MRLTLALLFAASPLLRAADVVGSFDKDVLPILRDTCSGCHNAKVVSGGLNLTPFMDSASVLSKREGWEAIVAKLRAGEMPPDGIPKPSDEKMNALLKYVQGEFEKADKNTKIDPGRVTAHRLNRVEYSNTIHDLLGVDFRASDEFPADDSGYGFDNIGDVLTVSPALMQKYLSVAEKIAARAVGGDPLPKAGFFTDKERVRHLPGSGIELTDIVDYDADYIVHVNILGHRGKDSKPVTLVISVDGKPYKTSTLPVQISAVNQQGGATQRAYEEVKVFLTGNQHTFRAEFVNDEELEKIRELHGVNFDEEAFDRARTLFTDLVVPSKFAEFLTLTAYEQIG